MRVRLTVGLAALCSVTALSIGVAQQGAPPSPEKQAENAVKVRQGLFDVQSFAFGPVGAMLKGAPFDAATAEKAGARIQVTASMIPDVFQTDTRKFTVTTKAREGIWTNKSDFDAKAKDLQMAAANLEAAAKTGDKGATLKAAGLVGKACGSCHDQFREKT
jgi:cytochrome c556